MAETNELFMTATRSKFRFPSSAGSLTVEDLWDLPLTGRSANLDDIARGLHRQLKEADGDVSFVKPAVKTTAELQAKFDIVKYVIDAKMTERDARVAAEEKAAVKQRILGIIAKKKDEALEGKSVEELQTLLEAM